MAVKEGYRQTEVGVIPEDWGVVSLENLCLPKGLVRGPFGGALKKEFFVQSGYKVYEQRNAIYKDIQIGSYYVDKSKYIELNRFAVLAGDMIISCSGTIGRIYKIPKKHEQGIINQALLKITLDLNQVVDDYFEQYFSWEEFQKKIIDNTQGGAMKNLVGMDIFKNTPFPVPPLPEQKAIATALSDIDGLINSLSRLIEKKKNIKQGAMQELLTGKKRLEGFSGEWTSFELGDLIDYEQPTNYIVMNTDYVEQGIPVLTAGKSLILGYTNESAGVYENLPVIIFDDFTTTSKYVDFKFKVKSSAMKILKLKNSAHNLRLIFEYMQIVNFPLTDHQRYWITEYSKIKIKLPGTLEEQTVIATILSDMDSEIETLQTKLNKYKAIKQGMMQELLTGRIRLLEGA